MKHRHITVLAATAVVTGLLTAGQLAPAHASDDDGRVIRTGACDGGARWKIKAKEDDGRLEVEAEVDSNRVGQRWTWVLVHDGSVSARGADRTAGRSGSFSVERTTVDGPGTDSFTFRARHGEQLCVARVRYPA